MITVVSGTNRTNSETELVATFIYKMLQEHGAQEVQLLRLTELPAHFITNEMYSPNGQDDRIGAIQDQFMRSANKFWFVFPEYNGGVPGVLKLFIDAISVRYKDETFTGKKACLTGVSSGRAGNLRGLDHLTNILNYLKVVVLPNRLPISSIKHLKDMDGNLSDAGTQNVLRSQMDEFLLF